MDLAQHRERVVGGDRIGPETDRRAGRLELDDRRHPARGELQVGARAVGDPDPGHGEAGDLGAREPDRVGGDLSGTEEADLPEPVGRPAAGLRLVLATSLPGLGEVVVDEGPFPECEVPGPQPGLRVADVHALGCDERHHARVVAPPPDERCRVVQRACPSASSSRGRGPPIRGIPATPRSTRPRGRRRPRSSRGRGTRSCPRGASRRSRRGPRPRCRPRSGGRRPRRGSPGNRRGPGHRRSPAAGASPRGYAG